MNSTVYYPNLFPPESWLRVASLCWDNVYTLRSPTASKMPPELVDFNEQIGGFIVQRDTVTLGKEEDVSSKFKVWLKSEGKTKLSEGGPTLNDSQWYQMFADKFPTDIFNKLKADSLLMPIENTHEVHVPILIADHYMSLCAAKLAEVEGADLFADQETFAETAMFNKQVRGKITKSIVEAYIPENLASLEIAQIGDLRKELSAQRLKFQGAVQSLCDEFAKTTSEEKFQSKQKEILEIATERVELVKGTYERAKLMAVLTGLGMSLIPGSIAQVASMLGVGVFLPAAIVSAIATVTASILIQREKARDEMKSSSWSYVLQVAQQTKNA